jgi:hypothetical protein
LRAAVQASSASSSAVPFASKASEKVRPRFGRPLGFPLCPLLHRGMVILFSFFCGPERTASQSVSGERVNANTGFPALGLLATWGFSSHDHYGAIPPSSSDGPRSERSLVSDEFETCPRWGPGMDRPRWSTPIMLKALGIDSSITVQIGPRKFETCPVWGANLKSFISNETLENTPFVGLRPG